MSAGFFSHTRQLLADWARRLWRSRLWIALQVISIALLLLAGLSWTRIPEKHAWQVLFSLLIPVLLAALFLLLQAATMRSLARPLAKDAGHSSPRVSIAWGAATLILWFLLFWVAWILLDRFDDQIEIWSGYLNSRFGAGPRARIATQEHIVSLLTYVGRALRWVIVPGLLVPLLTSAAWGIRKPPWRRALRIWLNWRWWPAVLAAALIGVAWPHSFFAALPHGSVAAQVWRVVLKLVGAYLLAVASWLAILAWAATLICAARPSAARTDDEPDDLAGVGVRFKPPGGGRSGSVRLPLPESSDDTGGNA